MLFQCESQQVTGESQQVTGESQQVTGESQQVTGESQQVTGESQQVTGEFALDGVDDSAMVHQTTTSPHVDDDDKHPASYMPQDRLT
jgi:uncharacterized protein YjbJ (UPF0337 family)